MSVNLRKTWCHCASALRIKREERWKHSGRKEGTALYKKKKNRLRLGADFNRSDS